VSPSRPWPLGGGLTLAGQGVSFAPHSQCSAAFGGPRRKQNSKRPWLRVSVRRVGVEVGVQPGVCMGLGFQGVETPIQLMQTMGLRMRPALSQPWAFHDGNALVSSGEGPAVAGPSLVAPLGPFSVRATDHPRKPQCHGQGGPMEWLPGYVVFLAISVAVRYGLDGALDALWRSQDLDPASRPAFNSLEEWLIGAAIGAFAGWIVTKALGD
jgi:hypothetical protein